MRAATFRFTSVATCYVSQPLNFVSDLTIQHRSFPYYQLDNGSGCWVTIPSGAIGTSEKLAVLTHFGRETLRQSH